MQAAIPTTSVYETVLSPQGQITVPVHIRKSLGLKPGTRISVVAKKLQQGLTAIIAYALPADPVETYYGVGRSAYRKWGGVDKVVSDERRSWRNR